MGAGGLVVLRRVRRGARGDRPPRPASPGARAVGAAGCDAAHRGRDPEAGPRPRRRPVRPLVRHPWLRAVPVLGRRRAEDRARGHPTRGRAAGRPGRPPRRPRTRGNAGILPEQRALVFADAMTAPGGVLRVWGTPWHEERVLPAFRAMLDLPFEHVLLSHGEPVHTRADFEVALEREP